MARFNVQLAEAPRNSLKKKEQRIIWVRLGNNFWKEIRRVSVAQGVYRSCDETCLSKAGPPDDCLKRFISVILNTKHESSKKEQYFILTILIYQYLLTLVN